MNTSESLFEQAKQFIPGGVNSPVRAFGGVGGTPIYFKKAQGAYLFDEQNRKYIDYVGSWGPMIMGHNHPYVVQCVKEQIDCAMSFGAPTEIETRLAMKICQTMPSIEKVRMVNSGTEATMSAIRLARGYTNRDKIIKFEGCYHGHTDSLLVKAGSGALTFGVPTSAGIPEDLARHTLTLSFNDIEMVQKAFALHGDDIACIIVEPVAGNMNCIPPQPGFLETLRDVCDETGAVLIFDEVMTGFRVAPGGAQDYYNINPDITTLGKIIGGGLPVGAFGGRADIMDKLSPQGPVYQAGTLSGNPVAMASGLATLELISQTEHLYEKIEHLIEQLLNGFQEKASKHEVPFSTQAAGGMFGFFFSEDAPGTFEQSINCNGNHFKLFFHEMLKQGIYLAPSAFEAGFLSFSHTEKDIQRTIECADKAFKIISQTG